MAYILGRLISWNIKFEKVDNKCVRVYGNFDGFSVVRESEQENYIEVDGRLIDYEDFEDWLYVIKQWNDSFRKVNVMKVLSEMSTGMGSKWILAKFSNDFYGYGTEMDFKSAWGLPVNQCGTKTEVLENCLRMQNVNLDFIDKYNKELLKEKKKPDGWKKLIEHEKMEYDMHLKFANILKESDWEVEIEWKYMY